MGRTRAYIQLQQKIAYPFTSMEVPRAFTGFVVLAGFLLAGVDSASFQFHNNCTYTIWAGTLSGAGTPPLSSTGFPMSPASTVSLSAPSRWSGRFWARTGCSTDATTGRLTCSTGDCGTGQLSCSGSGAIPPATLAEITLGNGKDMADFYDISLVDGYNVPMALAPVGSQGKDCKTASCAHNVNQVCPHALQVLAAAEGKSQRAVVACQSACGAFGSPEYCCTGAYAGGPNACKPSNYSELFKAACPTAYSYAYDDATSTFTCHSDNYLVTFCP